MDSLLSNIGILSIFRIFNGCALVVCIYLLEREREREREYTPRANITQTNQLKKTSCDFFHGNPDIFSTIISRNVGFRRYLNGVEYRDFAGMCLVLITLQSDEMVTLCDKMAPRHNKMALQHNKMALQHNATIPHLYYIDPCRFIKKRITTAVTARMRRMVRTAYAFARRKSVTCGHEITNTAQAANLCNRRNARRAKHVLPLHVCWGSSENVDPGEWNLTEQFVKPYKSIFFAYG
ncbi:MAG: hypothetical protein LBT83_04860 [Tannerella sp.]|jgi:hypothetical protein|nr:hypothetical protein [Tannerella sp.]